MLKILILRSTLIIAQEKAETWNFLEENRLYTGFEGMYVKRRNMIASEVE